MEDKARAEVVTRLRDLGFSDDAIQWFTGPFADFEDVPEEATTVTVEIDKDDPNRVVLTFQEPGAYVLDGDVRKSTLDVKNEGQEFNRALQKTREGFVTVNGERFTY